MLLPMHQLYLCTTYAWVASPPQNEPNVRPKDKSRGGWVLPQAHVGGGTTSYGAPTHMSWLQPCKPPAGLPAAPPQLGSTG